MWMNKVDPVNEKNIIFHELLEECKYLVPGARLSCSLRNRLEKYPISVRKEIVNRIKVGCSPLFIACKRGQTEIVEYLITVCGADIEQQGLYEVPDDRSTHIVTPLWCAAVSGKLAVVQILHKFNADINAISDTGSSPVRSACFMTHYDVVKYLVENGADINRANYNGGTCLINSVQSKELCQLLLDNGANVNARDIQNKTALHYAIQEHRLETTKLLLKYGANCLIRSRYGDDALQTACLKGAVPIFNYLMENKYFLPEKLANANELMGATVLDEHNDPILATHHWRMALAIRWRNDLFPKQPQLEPRAAYQFQKEFETVEELDDIATDLDLLRIQSLLISERILGSHHKDTIFRLMYRGAAYADILRYQQCIDLWRRALEIRVEKDSILYTDTCFTAQALVRQMVDYYERVPPTDEIAALSRLKDIILTFNCLTNDILNVRQLLNIKPIWKRQADLFDKILKCITHLMLLMIEVAQDFNKVDKIASLVKDIIEKNPRTVSNDDTILHLCVSRSNVIRSNYFVDDDPIVLYPKYNVLQFLIKCKAPLNAKNDTGSTPLHIATMPGNYSAWVVKLLLENGAHIDTPNNKNFTPLKVITEMGKTLNTDIHILDYISLKCLCANVIREHQIPYKNEIPKTLEAFIQYHE